MATLQLATLAMATRFELVLQGPSLTALRSAGEEAIAEIQRLDATLSVHRPESEIAALNRSAAIHPVRVSPEVFRLLQHSVVLTRATRGAFDITVGPLLQAWGFVRGSGHLPDPAHLDAVRAAIGPSQLLFDESTFSIALAHPAARMDLGAIGKGYALDRAAALLHDAGITDALLHGGTSTAVAWGRPEGAQAWRIAIDPPTLGCASTPSPTPLAIVDLHDESLSVSAVWGKGFSLDGRFYGHVIDPRSGQPTEGALLAAMILPSATESDALSTALLVRGSEMVSCLRDANAPARCLVAIPSGDSVGYRIDAWGMAPQKRDP
jgi:thiamine biosynthesis lipoprotein